MGVGKAVPHNAKAELKSRINKLPVHSLMQLFCPMQHLGAAQHRAGTGTVGKMGGSSREPTNCSEPEGRRQIQPY